MLDRSGNLLPVCRMLNGTPVAATLPPWFDNTDYGGFRGYSG